jgi:hypothetical protein
MQAWLEGCELRLQITSGPYLRERVKGQIANRYGVRRRRDWSLNDLPQRLGFHV